MTYSVVISRFESVNSLLYTVFFKKSKLFFGKAACNVWVYSSVRKHSCSVWPDRMCTLAELFSAQDLSSKMLETKSRSWYTSTRTGECSVRQHCYATCIVCGVLAIYFNRQHSSIYAVRKLRICVSAPQARRSRVPSPWSSQHSLVLETPVTRVPSSRTPGHYGSQLLKYNASW